MNSQDQNSTFFEKWLLKKFEFTKDAEWEGIFHLICFDYVVEATISFEESRRIDQHKESCKLFNGWLECGCGINFFTENERKAQDKLINKIQQIQKNLQCCEFMEADHKKDSDRSCCKRSFGGIGFTTLIDHDLIFAGDNKYDSLEDEAFFDQDLESNKFFKDNLINSTGSNILRKLKNERRKRK